MKTLKCADVGFTCATVLKAETEQEILQEAAEHAATAHGVSVTPEMADQIKKLIKEA